MHKSNEANKIINSSKDTCCAGEASLQFVFGVRGFLRTRATSWLHYRSCRLIPSWAWLETALTTSWPSNAQTWECVSSTGSRPFLLKTEAATTDEGWDCCCRLLLAQISIAELGGSEQRLAPLGMGALKAVARKSFGEEKKFVSPGASLASSFTVRCLDSCVSLLREGRCVLQNSIALVLFITLYSVIELGSVLTMYTAGKNLTDAQVRFRPKSFICVSLTLSLFLKERMQSVCARQVRVSSVHVGGLGHDSSAFARTLASRGSFLAVNGSPSQEFVCKTHSDFSARAGGRSCFRPSLRVSFCFYVSLWARSASVLLLSVNSSAGCASAVLSSGCLRGLSPDSARGPANLQPRT